MKSLKEILAQLKGPEDQPVEVKPGHNVFFGRTVKLTVRVWREKEQRWYDVP
jgi:hypothetical protein